MFLFRQLLFFFCTRAFVWWGSSSVVGKRDPSLHITVRLSGEDGSSVVSKGRLESRKDVNLRSYYNFFLSNYDEKKIKILNLGISINTIPSDPFLLTCFSLPSSSSSLIQNAAPSKAIVLGERPVVADRADGGGERGGHV